MSSNPPPFRIVGPDGNTRSIRPAAPHPLGNIRPAADRTEADLLAALGLPAAPPKRGDVPAGLSQVCDFCERAPEQHPPAWYYPTKSTMPVEIGGIEVEFAAGALTGSGWVACDECHAFIVGDDFAGLADFIGYPQLQGTAVDQFRKIMLGPGQRLRQQAGE